jgi:peptidoglycan/xylan/chitin deacetylase (PgdA/CDA1 family)
MATTRSGPSYLVRFDDICPTVAWDQWSLIEDVLMSEDIRPIMAVIADNKDVSLHQGPTDPQFWDRVRRWQQMGWTIGLHGYQHLYVSKSTGIVGLNRYSEFAGLSFDQQFAKLQAAFKIFEQERVQPDIWVAPAHTFDENTLRALKCLPLQIISDGFQPRPHTDREGFFWIPQQLGDFRYMPCGVWTVCIHHEDVNYNNIQLFRHKIERFRKYITDVPEVVSRYSGTNSSTFSESFALAWRWAKVMKSARL